VATLILFFIFEYLFKKKSRRKQQDFIGWQKNRGIKQLEILGMFFFFFCTESNGMPELIRLVI
jgi:hypothetical protein